MKTPSISTATRTLSLAGALLTSACGPAQTRPDQITPASDLIAYKVMGQMQNLDCEKTEVPGFFECVDPDGKEFSAIAAHGEAGLCVFEDHHPLTQSHLRFNPTTHTLDSAASFPSGETHTLRCDAQGCSVGENLPVTTDPLSFEKNAQIVCATLDSVLPSLGKATQTMVITAEDLADTETEPQPTAQSGLYQLLQTIGDSTLKSVMPLQSLLSPK